ncbi:MAG: hypothetical protein NTV62_01710 [Candidatus Gribaldobacteria bacterium]|nr:hypothetical protein [Candidatus Gribaldobacteria bacterium]
MDTKNTKKIKKLPEDFKMLMWGYDFDKIDPEQAKELIIINTLNYGSWRQWKWLVENYGLLELKKIIENTPKSEFRNYRALSLISLILGIKKMKYENRGIKIQAKGNTPVSL